VTRRRKEKCQERISALKTGDCARGGRGARELARGMARGEAMLLAREMSGCPGSAPRPLCCEGSELLNEDRCYQPTSPGTGSPLRPHPMHRTRVCTMHGGIAKEPYRYCRTSCTSPALRMSRRQKAHTSRRKARFVDHKETKSPTVFCHLCFYCFGK
jgi:hypothetical protein